MKRKQPRIRANQKCKSHKVKQKGVPTGWAFNKQHALSTMAYKAINDSLGY